MLRFWINRWIIFQLLLFITTKLSLKFFVCGNDDESLIEMFTDSNVQMNNNDDSRVNNANDNDKTKMAECHLRPVIHILQRAGCIPKPIPSFACYGTCNSYVQVSDSKFWELERSCNCCQEIGEREASIMLHCPGQTPQHRRVTTRAPVECLCRPCSAIDEQQVKPLEMLFHNNQHHHHQQPSSLSSHHSMDDYNQEIDRRNYY